MQIFFMSCDKSMFLMFPNMIENKEGKFSKETGPEGKANSLRVSGRFRFQESTVMPLHRNIHSRITLDGENAVENRFWGHPFHRKLFSLLCVVHVFVDLTHQPKV